MPGIRANPPAVSDPEDRPIMMDYWGAYQPGAEEVNNTVAFLMGFAENVIRFVCDSSYWYLLDPLRECVRRTLRTFLSRVRVPQSHLTLVTLAAMQISVSALGLDESNATQIAVLDRPEGTLGKPQKGQVDWDYEGRMVRTEFDDAMCHFNMPVSDWLRLGEFNPSRRMIDKFIRYSQQLMVVVDNLPCGSEVDIFQPPRGRVWPE